MAELVFPARPARPAPPPERPLLRNSTPTRNARSRRSDGFGTIFGAFRELFAELFSGLSRPFNLESSRRKQAHFILQCQKRIPPLPPGTTAQDQLASFPHGYAPHV